jgi:hypothetical protein
MTITEAVLARVREQARNRCGYCQVEGQYVYATMEIDHIFPKAHGGTDEEENLWLACPWCNAFKRSQTHGIDPISGERVELFNPRRQKWKEHFTWAEDRASILGLTPCGRATAGAVQLNFELALALRRQFVTVGWYPPKD